MNALKDELKTKLPVFAAAAFAVLAFGVVLYYILALSPAYFHSDCTDSLLWALASYESGDIFNPDFGYAAMLPFGASLWFVPLIAIFGVTMKTQLLGMAVFLVIFTLSLFFMCRSFKWSLTRSFFTVAAVLLILSGSDKLREIMWGHVIYYSLGIVFVFLLLGLCARIADCIGDAGKVSGKKTVVLIALMFVLTALTATDGFQVIGITILPVAAAVALMMLFESKTLLISAENRKNWVLILTSGVASVFGLVALIVLRRGVSAGYSEAYSCYSDMDAVAENMLKVPKHLLTLLGANWYNGAPLLDSLSIMNVARIGFALLIIICPVILFCSYKKLSRNAKLVLWTHTVITSLIVFLMVFGRLAAANWRMTPVLATGILVVLETGALFFRGENSLKRLAALGTAFVVLLGYLNMTSVFSMLTTKDTWKGEDSYYSFASYLKENGLTNGYATFWQSNRLTLLSDSEVVLRTVDLKTEGIIPTGYQSDTKWYTLIPDDERVCLVLTKSEYDELKSFDWWKNGLSERLVDVLTYEVNFVKNINDLPDRERQTYRVLVFEGDILTR